ncbi:MAG: hypothetical protein AABY22_25305, partial [Nanoarchaeota archaeon]
MIDELNIIESLRQHEMTPEQSNMFSIIRGVRLQTCDHKAVFCYCCCPCFETGQEIIDSLMDK